MKGILLFCLLLTGLSVQLSMANGRCSSEFKYIDYKEHNPRYYYAFAEVYVGGCDVNDQKPGVHLVVCDTSYTGHCTVVHKSDNYSTYGSSGAFRRGYHYELRVAARYKKWYQRSRWKIIDHLENYLFFIEPD